MVVNRFVRAVVDLWGGRIFASAALAPGTSCRKNNRAATETFLVLASIPRILVSDQLARCSVGIIARLIIYENFGLWLSLVERCVRDAEAVGSNPTSPISFEIKQPDDVQRQDDIVFHSGVHVLSAKK